MVVLSHPIFIAEASKHPTSKLKLLFIIRASKLLLSETFRKGITLEGKVAKRNLERISDLQYNTSYLDGFLQQTITVFESLLEFRYWGDLGKKEEVLVIAKTR